MKNIIPIFLISIFTFCSTFLVAQKDKTAKDDKQITLDDISLNALSFRSIGPSVTGGRIIDIDVNPENPSEYYIASGHGSLWKTTNRGITFKPIFDQQESFAIGAVTLQPGNPNVVWVGTGEKNAQSFVIPGDGVYKSEDGGKSWTNKGLKESQQIGELLIHPTDPNTIWVAAYGPHRTSGGERGVYKSTDGGENWERVLFISDHTGVWQLHMDPRDPDVIYAVAHQRQRYLHTRIGGGDESGIHKSMDGGESWIKLKGGLPQKNVGRIGMDISPVNPDVLFAVVNAKDKKGIYKSMDRGASWTKQSSYQTAYPFYLQKIVCDVKDIDKLFALDIFTQVSYDSGKSWKNLGESKKHVDNHALWIDPNNNKHLLSGCDGGLYESFDNGKNWDFKSNIPIAEVYKVSVDNSKPFYNVFIGTQDNLSLGGPSRTINSGGIANSDWFFTLGGDGFESQVDWKDPNIIYSQYQNGGLYRYDKSSGEKLFIKSHEFEDTSYRFDWDAALLLSKHDHKRLYHCGNKVLRSDDRGNSWKEVSPDLTRGVPKEFHPLMDRSWSIDELVGKGSMAQIVTIAESPFNEDHLYVGSGDGLIHYTKNGGENWIQGKAEGLPPEVRIHHLIASNHDSLVAYAACQNLFAGDYHPYLYKTTDGGDNWFSINANLPKGECTFTIGEDHVDPNLLFVGTMYGVYLSNTKDHHWKKLSSGIPNAATVMDLDIHREENDLVVSTYGRGVFIIDDYSPMRKLKKDVLEKDFCLFDIPDADMFIEADPFGYSGVGFQGASYYTAKNPKVGAVITYYIKDGFKSLKEARREKEKELQKEGKTVEYPSYEQLKKESEEIKPYLLFTILDEEGNVVRKYKKSISKGLHSLVWDFRYSAVSPITMSSFDDSVPWSSADLGYLVTPGKYAVRVSKIQGAEVLPLGSEKSFVCKALNNTSLPASNQEELEIFNKKVASLARAAHSADDYRRKMDKLIPYLEKAILEVNDFNPEWLKTLASIKDDLKEIKTAMNGDPLISKYEGAPRQNLQGKLNMITSNLWSTTAEQTKTFENAYKSAANGFEDILEKIKNCDQDMRNLQSQLDKAGAPGTPGLIPEWIK